MDQRSTQSLISAGRVAALLVAAHASLTLRIVARPQSGPSPLFQTPRSLFLEPALLLAGQVVALAGLIYLAVTLRNVARGMARTQTSDSGEPVGNRRTKGEPGRDDVVDAQPSQVVATVGAALLFAVCYAAGLWTAARGLLGPVGLAGLLLLPGSLVLLAGGQAPGRGLRWSQTQWQQWISRLRGASIGVAVAGFALTVASGSLVAGSLLPVAMLRHLPSGPPPTSEDWAVGPAPAKRAFAPVPPSAQEAGEAIHSLFFAGSPRSPQPLERAPVRRYDGWWELESPPTLPLPPHEWAEHLYAAARSGGLDPRQIAFLKDQSLHPANDEFDRLEGPPSADIAGSRWRPLDDRPVAAFELPVPRYVELWNGVRGRIAGATYLALQGDPDEAKRRLGTVVHLGRLLNQDGPLTLDAVLGARIAEEASLAAQSLEGAKLRATAASTEPPAPPPNPPALLDRLEWLRQYEAALGTADAPRGVRWEAYTLVSSFLPCSSPAATLWGPAPSLSAWRTETAAALSTRASEAEMAKVLAEGYLGTRAGGEGWGWLPKVLSVTLADRPAATHCAPLVAAVMGLY